MPWLIITGTLLCFSTCPSVHKSTDPIHPSDVLSSIHLSACPSIHPYIRPSIHPPVHPSIPWQPLRCCVVQRRSRGLTDVTGTGRRGINSNIEDTTTCWILDGKRTSALPTSPHLLSPTRPSSYLPPLYLSLSSCVPFLPMSI